jgi:nicotinate-nucleotide adenylyltransferase
MGADNLQTFHKWKNYEELIKQVEIYVYPRPGFDGGQFKNHPKVKFTDAPLMEISSTFIRNSVKQKKRVDFFVHDKVWNHIREMHFYEK